MGTTCRENKDFAFISDESDDDDDDIIDDDDFDDDSLAMSIDWTEIHFGI